MIYMGKPSVVLVTSSDLDGVGCRILIEKAFGVENVITYHCETSEVNQIVEQVYQNTPEHVAIYIANNEVNEDIAETLNQRGNVYLLDRHATGLWLKKYKWAFVKPGVCGSKLVFEYLKQIGFNAVLEYEPFVFHVNDYEMRLYQSPFSTVLNRLFSLLGKDRFTAKLLRDASLELTKLDQLRLDEDIEKKEAYFSFYTKEQVCFSTDLAFGYVFGDQYVSELGMHLLQSFKGLQMVAVIDVRKRKVSLQSKPGFNVLSLAKKFGGGGDEQSCEFSLTNDHLDNWMKKLVI
jgi:oligoribonuclease NrnB/cAMP/cGMP phosphodiesterase (DHH superfamily)